MPKPLPIYAMVRFSQKKKDPLLTIRSMDAVQAITGCSLGHRSLAGGEPLNRGFPRKGKPGIMIEPADLVRINLEVIIISGFLSTPVEDTYAICKEQGIDVQAVRDRRIHVMPPSWDFGNPRWILGLSFLAGVLHPQEIRTDPEEEADRFYQKFYHIPYAVARPNRSFFRPSAG